MRDLFSIVVEVGNDEDVAVEERRHFRDVDDEKLCKRWNNY